MLLQGKKALITGGSSGIGLATAKLFKQNGARVAITGTDQGKLERAKAEIGGDTVAIQANVVSVADLTRMAEETKAAFGTLDIFFANAGAAAASPLGATEEAVYTRLMDVNVKGVFFSVQAVVPLMTRGGSIILNSSWLDLRGVAGRGILSASKAAVRSFARTFAAELAPKGIRVNAVTPGFIRTDMLKGLPEQKLTEALAGIRMGRAGEPADVAKVILFLASDLAGYVTGQVLGVDGGMIL